MSSQHFSARYRYRFAALGVSLLCLLQLVPLQAAETSGFTPMVITHVSPTRQLAMLKAICDEGTLGMEDGTPVCRVCPDFTGQTGDKNATLRINNVIEGTFSRPGAAEALVDLEGCEPHANMHGGAALLRRDADGWKRGLYQPAFRPGECISFRTLERTQALACNVVDSAQGIQIGELQWVTLYDGEFRSSTLLRWFDNVQSNPRRLVSVFPYDFMKSDYNQDARVDLRVLLRLRDQPVPPKYAGAIDAIADGYHFPEAETLRLIYLFNGSNLTLLPESKDVKARIDRLLEQHL